MVNDTIDKGLTTVWPGDPKVGWLGYPRMLDPFSALKVWYIISGWAIEHG